MTPTLSILATTPRYLRPLPSIQRPIVRLTYQARVRSPLNYWISGRISYSRDRTPCSITSTRLHSLKAGFQPQSLRARSISSQGGRRGFDPHRPLQSWELFKSNKSYRVQRRGCRWVLTIFSNGSLKHFYFNF